MSADQRLVVSQTFSNIGYIGSQNGYDISRFPTLRAVVENAGLTNTIVIEVKLFDEANWTTLDTIVATGSKNIDISSYELLRFRCSQYQAAGIPKLIFSSFFKRPVGGTVEFNSPNGDAVQARSVNFISSDNSVIITGNATTNEIDFKAANTGASLASLTDVNIPAPNDGEVLSYDTTTSKWISSPALTQIQTATPTVYLTNNTGSTINAYTPVIVNTAGDMGLVDVSDSSKVSVVGLTIDDILNTGAGEIRADRVLKNVITPFLLGDTLYVSKTGGLTNILPSVGSNGFVSGDFVIKIGVVSKNQTNPAQKDIILNPEMIVQLS